MRKFNTGWLKVKIVLIDNSDNICLTLDTPLFQLSAPPTLHNIGTNPLPHKNLIGYFLFLGKCHAFLSSNQLFEKNVSELSCQSVKHFGSRLGPTICKGYQQMTLECKELKQPKIYLLLHIGFGLFYGGFNHFGAKK